MSRRKVTSEVVEELDQVEATTEATTEAPVVTITFDPPPEKAPELSPQTLAEMEAGRKLLEQHAKRDA